MNMEKMNFKIQVLLYSFLFVTTLTNAQLKLESNGNIKIGTMPYYPLDSKLEIALHENIPLETVLYSSTKNISRFWMINPLNSIGLGVDENGLGQIYVQAQSPKSIMTFCSNGNVGLDKTPSFKLDVNGVLRVNNLIIFPEEQLRHKVKPIKSQSKSLYLLNAILYQIRNNKKEDQKTENKSGDTERVYYGFTISEVKELFPELIYEDEKGKSAIDYISFIPLLLNELKIQKEEISLLKKELENLKTK